MNRSESASRSAPRLEIDLYADDVLADSRDAFARIRHAGPAVWLPRHRMYAMGRFDDVRAALRDPETFISGDGVAANRLSNRLGRGTTLFSDGQLHDSQRRILRQQLGPTRARGDPGPRAGTRGAHRRPVLPRRLIRRSPRLLERAPDRRRRRAGGRARRERADAALGGRDVRPLGPTQPTCRSGDANLARPAPLHAALQRGRGLAAELGRSGVRRPRPGSDQYPTSPGPGDRLRRAVARHHDPRLDPPAVGAQPPSRGVG